MAEETVASGVSAVVTSRAVTFQIVSTVVFTFFCYLAIGVQLAILPSYVVGLALGSLVAGLVISVQYVATLSSRVYAGSMADSVGPKQTVQYGLSACGVSGLFLLGSAFTEHMPAISLLCLIVGRLALGFGESWVSTGALTWGIARVGAANTASVISWNGIATYGALALGAPIGVIFEKTFGFSAIGLTVLLLGVAGIVVAVFKQPTKVIRGEHLPVRAVLGRVLPYGFGLALGSAGFGTIATFITLFYASRHWPNA